MIGKYQRRANPATRSLHRQFLYWFDIQQFLQTHVGKHFKAVWLRSSDLKPSASRLESPVNIHENADGHLCDVAKEMLKKYAAYFPAIEEIDIDNDDALVARYGETIPVVEIDGKERFRGRVDEVLLKRLIDGTQRGVEQGSGA